MSSKLEKATFAGGCFWCTETIFKKLKGVREVTPGYSGGESKDPDYWTIHGGARGHAESVQVEFDPQEISYEDLLYVFFRTHDPTTLNRQGADVDPEYRSVVFYHNDKQKKLTEKAIKRLEEEGFYEDEVVTEVVPFEEFYPEEKEHNDYYKKNKGNVYCKLVIDPKIKKLEKDFSEFVK